MMLAILGTARDLNRLPSLCWTLLFRSRRNDPEAIIVYRSINYEVFGGMVCSRNYRWGSMGNKVPARDGSRVSTLHNKPCSEAAKLACNQGTKPVHIWMVVASTAYAKSIAYKHEGPVLSWAPIIAESPFDITSVSGPRVCNPSRSHGYCARRASWRLYCVEPRSDVFWRRAAGGLTDATSRRPRQPALLAVLE
jgi:hypothetical protein